MSTLDVVIATIGKAHGLRGEAALNLRTDDPARRLVPGAEFTTGGDPAVLTISRVRRHGEAWLVAFTGHADRSAAEALRGVELHLAVDTDEESEEDPGAWYPEDLIGLTAVDGAGAELGTVTGLQHYPAQDVLVVRHGGRNVLVPFVEAIVPDVDTDGGRIVLDPPGGLFDDTSEASEVSGDGDDAGRLGNGAGRGGDGDEVGGPTR